MELPTSYLLNFLSTSVFFPVTLLLVCLAYTKQHQASVVFAEVDICFMSVPDSVGTQIPKMQGLT